jgi:phosphomethylpyrimidine synthase
MNANEKFIAAKAQVDEAAIAPLPNSRKIYVEGSRPDIRVPMREITQSDTPASFGAEPNPPIFVYDCSGPYTDPAAKIDIRSGLPALRQRWIEERGDTEVLADLTSEYGRQRAADPSLNDLRFPGLHRKPRRALPGRNVSQMHYARQGHVTEEMAFVAEREGLPVEFIREELAAGRLVIPANIHHLELEPAAVGKAVNSGLLQLERQLFFSTRSHFDDFAQFDQRMIQVTHSDHRLSPEPYSEVRRRSKPT